MNGAPVNRSPALEAEAERAGQRAAAGLPVTMVGAAAASPGGAPALGPTVIQRSQEDEPGPPT